jgi:pimeloyl-ACP methyl ester carboxylesterase
MDTVRSKDGTRIAYDRVGNGPPVLLVGGATATRSDPDAEELAQRLSLHFTAINYDRRGRGDSGDTLPYAVAREIEDIEALIDANGGAAYLFGMSSGGALVLESAAALPGKVVKAAIYEAPYIVDASHAPLPSDYVPHLQALVAAGRRGDAVAYFMRAAVGVPEEYIAQMRSQPMWPGLEKIAHTIAYDGMVMGDKMAGKPFAPGAWATAEMPILLINGGAGEPFMGRSADALAQILPNAQRLTMPDQTHAVEPSALAPVLIDFFTN